MVSRTMHSLKGEYFGIKWFLVELNMNVICPTFLGRLQPNWLSNSLGGERIATTGVSGPSSARLRTIVCAAIPTAPAVAATADTTHTICSTLGAG